MDLYNKYKEKQDLIDKIKATKKKIAQAHTIMQLDELKCRKRVLRRLGFIDDADIVQLKARVACEISSGDELLLSELLFNRVFNELSPELTAALLSCFVFEEKSNNEETLKEELGKPFRELQSQAKLIAKVSIESKLPMTEEEYVNKFKPQLMEVVYSWAQGSSFSTIWFDYSPYRRRDKFLTLIQQNDRCVRGFADPYVQTSGGVATPDGTGI